MPVISSVVADIPVVQMHACLRQSITGKDHLSATRVSTIDGGFRMEIGGCGSL